MQMGSHTLIDNQACTTAGTQPKNAPIKPSDSQCAGKKRMFNWDNSYYQDVTSGTCEPRVRVCESLVSCTLICSECVALEACVFTVYRQISSVETYASQS